MLKEKAEALIAAIDKTLQDKFDPKNINSQSITDWGYLTAAKAQLLRLVDLIERGVLVEEEK